MNHRHFFRQRPLVCLACAYGLGVLLGVFLPAFQPLLPITGFLMAALSLPLVWKKSLPRAISLLLVFLFAGCLLGGLAAKPALPAEGSYQVSARVHGQAEYSEDGRRVKAILRDVRLTNTDGETKPVGKAYWTWYPQPDEALPLDGQLLTFTGQAYHPEGQVNPHGFDFRQYLLQRGVHFGISGARELSLAGPRLTAHQSPWLRARDALAARLDSVLGPTHGALAKALLLGVRGDLDEALTSDFRTAGVAHILAVSGLHVGFLVIGMRALLRHFSLSPWAMLLVIGLTLLAYCRLLDFTPSIVRASVLTVMLLLGKALKRKVDPLTSLAAAFLCVLLFRPLDLLNLGFQLSFLAVLGIILLGDRFNSWLSGIPAFQRLPGWAQKAIQAYAVTLAASLMTLVPLINSFHQVSLVGLLVGPPAIALVGWLMACFIAVLLLSFVSLPLARLLAYPVNAFSSLYQGMVSLSAGLPLAAFQVRVIKPLAYLPFYLALWLLSRYSAVRAPAKKATLTLITALLILLPLRKETLPPRYIQLSAGFADSALILDGAATIVIDTGEHGGDLLSYLLSEGRGIDHLLLTHLHSDHAGGLRQLLDGGVRIDEILLPFGALDAKLEDGSRELLDEAEARGIPIRIVGRGDALQSARVRGEVRWPYQGALYPGMEPNRGSLVVYWNLNGLSLLTAGDLHADYAPYAYQPAQVLKLPHHGAKTDNPAHLLALVSPQLAIITAADHRVERYSAAMEHLVEMDAKRLVTGDAGAITLTAADNGLTVSSHIARRD